MPIHINTTNTLYIYKNKQKTQTGKIRDKLRQQTKDYKQDKCNRVENNEQRKPMMGQQQH